MSGICASVGCPNMGTILHSIHAKTQNNKKPDGMRYLPSWRCDDCSEKLTHYELSEGSNDEKELYLDQGIY